MNSQDIMHQAQDVFDRVTHRSSPLLPTCMERKSDTSSSSSSVLTSVAPPSALPSFIASPYPSNRAPPPPHMMAPTPPSGPSFTSPGPVPVSLAGTPGSGPSIGAPVPSPGLPPFPPLTSPGGQSPPPPPSATLPSVVPSQSHPVDQTPVGSGAAQTSLPSRNSTHSLTSHTPPPVSESQMHWKQQSLMPVIPKGHSRHHSYPLYVPGNPLHNPPSLPTPPYLTVHQEQAPYTSLSKSHNHLCTYLEDESPIESSWHSGEPYASDGAHVNIIGNSVGYSYGYSPYSEGSVDASASIDLGSPGVGGSLENPEGKGWFGWIRGTVSSVGHRVAEKAKTSMDTMITTLDPQMKEFIHSGGDMDIIVASDKEIKVGAVREAFQFMFGKATVSGMAAQAEGVAAQPVGFEAALQSAEKRINSLRSSGQVHPQQPIVSVENFIVEFTPDCWFDLGLLLLDDPGEDILLQTYTQVTPVPPDFVTQARDSTPRDYALKNSGFSTTIGQIASQNLQVHHTMWQETLTGVSRREMIVLAARSLAGLYKSRLPHSL